MARLCSLAICASLATPAVATLDEAATSAPYLGICQMDQTCNSNGACGSTPALGEMLLSIDADGAQIGRNDADFAPIDHFATLQDALPLRQIEGFRRTFLVDLPADGATRRFSVRVQIVDADTGAPALRPQHFILSCLATPA